MPGLFICFSDMFCKWFVDISDSAWPNRSYSSTQNLFLLQSLPSQSMASSFIWLLRGKTKEFSLSLFLFPFPTHSIHQPFRQVLQLHLQTRSRLFLSLHLTPAMWPRSLPSGTWTATGFPPPFPHFFTPPLYDLSKHESDHITPLTKIFHWPPVT